MLPFSHIKWHIYLYYTNIEAQLLKTRHVWDIFYTFQAAATKTNDMESVFLLIPIYLREIHHSFMNMWFLKYLASFESKNHTQ